MPRTQRPRVREAGITIGTGTPGRHNAITDVPGVRVGHVTLLRGEGELEIGKGPVRTGVTAILPPGNNWYDEPVEAGHFIFNGSGTVAGLSLIDEYGRIETPVLLTNSLSVGTAFEGIVAYMVEHVFKPRGHVPWFNPVVGETSDASMSDIGGLHVRPEHAVQAIEIATDGPVAEGNVGAGTGTRAMGYKAGIGTSSRLVEIEGETSTVGVLVQANFGGTLTVCGIDMATPLSTPTQPEGIGSSIMIIVATDVPLSNRLLNRISKRAVLGMARTGSSGGHGSGDYIISFSTTQRRPEDKPATRQALIEHETHINTVFQAVADATEEAILNSLFKAETVTAPDGKTWEAVPVDRIVQILNSHGLIHQPGA
ncbi:MAG: P1 family peptidase [bacterium]|nr:P1 family peptidase [bacterium]